MSHMKLRYRELGVEIVSHGDHLSHFPKGPPVEKRKGMIAHRSFQDVARKILLHYRGMR
jgi:hypothetical protein